MCSPCCIALRYYPPEKQGLRQSRLTMNDPCAPALRYYPPEKQGLRQMLIGCLHMDYQ